MPRSLYMRPTENTRDEVPFAYASVQLNILIRPREPFTELKSLVSGDHYSFLADHCTGQFILCHTLLALRNASDPFPSPGLINILPRLPPTCLLQQGFKHLYHQFYDIFVPRLPPLGFKMCNYIYVSTLVRITPQRSTRLTT